MKFSQEIDLDLTMSPLGYTRIAEVPGIAVTHDIHVDFWLFTGYIAYTQGLATDIGKHRMEYIFNSGRAAFERLYQQAV